MFLSCSYQLLLFYITKNDELYLIISCATKVKPELPLLFANTLQEFCMFKMRLFTND